MLGVQTIAHVELCTANLESAFTSFSPGPYADPYIHQVVLEKMLANMLSSVVVLSKRKPRNSTPLGHPCPLRLKVLTSCKDNQVHPQGLGFRVTVQEQSYARQFHKQRCTTARHHTQLHLVLPEMRDPIGRGAGLKHVWKLPFPHVI